MTTDEAIKIVAEFDGWSNLHVDRSIGEQWYGSHPDYTGTGKGRCTMPSYATDRDATIEAAKKLPEDWQDLWVSKVYLKLKLRRHNMTHPRLWAKLLTTEPETLLLALAETITEMKGEK